MSYETQRERDQRKYVDAHSKNEYAVYSMTETFDKLARGKLWNEIHAVENEFLKKELDKASKGKSSYDADEIESMKKDFASNEKSMASYKKSAMDERKELRDSKFFMDLIKDIYGDKVSFDKSIDKEADKNKSKASVKSDASADKNSKDESAKSNDDVLLKNISGKGLKMVKPKQGEPYYRVGLSVTSDVSDSGYATVFCKKDQLIKYGEKDVYDIKFPNDSERNVYVTKDSKDVISKMSVSALSASHSKALQSSKSKTSNREKAAEAALGDIKESQADIQKDDV